MTPINGPAAFVRSLSHTTFASIRLLEDASFALAYRHANFLAQANEGANAPRCRPLS